MTRGLLRSWTLILAAALLALPAHARAEAEIGTGYTAATVPYCFGWSGGTDGEGSSYLPCGSYISVIGPDGENRGSIQLEGGLLARRDVAPTWDGSALYFVSGSAAGIGLDEFEPAVRGADVGKVMRMVRRPDGAWERDPSFSVGPYWLNGPGMRPWAARNVTVDRAGLVYVTVNAFVMVYSPAGVLIAQLGSYDDGTEVIEGLAVTPDGRQVYLAEQKRNVVQRWDRRADGSWRRSSWQIGHDRRQVEDVAGSCGAGIDAPPTTDHLASPYDVGLDGRGNVYVMDTSCQRILKYGPAGDFLTSVWYKLSDMADLYHGFAVNWRGDVIVPEQGLRYGFDEAATTLAHSCAPDAEAPRFSSVVAAEVVYVPSLLVSLRATDRCSAVTSVRVTGEGVSGSSAWQPYRTSIAVALTRIAGSKEVTISVRDSWGRVRSVTRDVRFVDSLPAPRARVALPAPRASCGHNPAARLAAGWRVVDACARFSGHVVAVRRSGANRLVLVEVAAGTASLMYRDAAGPMRLWMVADPGTRGARRFVSGTRIVVTSALAMSPDRATLAAAPAWSWARA